MLSRSILLCIVCSQITAGQAENLAPDQRQFDENKTTDKLKSDNYGDEQILRAIWQKLFDIEERLSYLEKNRHPKIQTQIDLVSGNHIKVKRAVNNKGIYRVDRNTETMNDAGFFILE